MRTKHLLMTMALPLAFAACTSDEFESFNNQGEALKNRKDLGQVALMFEGDAQTRWTESLGTEVGDRVGAVLIDQFNGGKDEDPMKNYDVQDYQVYSNYMYEYDGTEWRTNANLVEGNYYFYAPYVAHQGRGLIKLNTPVVQTIDVDADGNIEPNSGIANFAKAAETPFVIGYKFLASTDDNTDVTISMKHLFAYPEFKFTNNSGEAVTLSRVLIENTGTGFVATGGLKNTAVAEQLFITGEQKKQDIENARDAYEAWDKTTQPAPEFASWGDWQKVFAYDKGGKTMPEGLDGLTTASLLDAPTYTELIRVDFSDNVTVADGETISFRVVMPAATFDTKDLALYFVVPDGKAYKVGMWENTTRTQVTTMLQDRYTAQDYSRDGNLGTGHKQFESEIDEDATLENAPSVVTDTESLIDLLRYERANEEAINITLAGSNIEFNQDVMDAIANMQSQSIEFSGLINVVGSKDAEKPMVIDENIAFDEVIVKEGYTTLNHRSLDYKAITVNNGATLTVNSISTSANGALVNKGTLVVGDAVIPSVDNYNAVEFVGSGSIIDLNAEGDEKAKKAQQITVGEDSEFTYQSGALYTVENNGTLIMPANAVIAGVVTNNADMVLKGGVTNKSTLTNEKDAGIEKAAGVAGATITNAGTLTNKGTIDCDIENQQPTTDQLAADKNLKFVINAEDGSSFLGEVSGTSRADENYMLVKGEPIFVKVTNTNLNVEYEAADNKALDSKMELPVDVNGNSFVNVLTVDGINVTAETNGNIDFEKNGLEKVDVLNINGDLSIDREVTLTLPNTLLEVNIEENSTLSSGTLTWTATSKKAVINIATGKTLTIVGGGISGNGAGVEFVPEYNDNGKDPGQVRNIAGTVNGCLNVHTEGWWTGNDPVMTEATDGDWTVAMNGGYTLKENTKLVGFGAGVTEVKVIAEEENTELVVSRSVESALEANNAVNLVIGEGVYAKFGGSANPWTGFDINKTNVEGEVEGVEIGVYVTSTITDYVWKNGAWVDVTPATEK